MNIEQIGEKFFCFIATKKLNSLRIFNVEDSIYESLLMDVLACEINCLPENLQMVTSFYDAESAARYEMNTRKPGWEWSGIPKSCGLGLHNEALWRQCRQLIVSAAIIRTGVSEWRVYAIIS